MRDRDDGSGEWDARRKPANAAIVAAVCIAVSLPAGFAGGFLIGRTAATPAPVPPPAPMVAPVAANPAPNAPPRVAPNADLGPERKALRMTFAAFKESVFGRTREQVEKKYGPPARSIDDLSGAWDGPVSVYEGDFTAPGGNKVKDVRLYYKDGVVAVVG
ncbi:hypothetical protein [Limnoglobus roseus]|uniref:Uncharacterized protein n=1 Tax=Limnoglobus roseus TaxID=2598579 RepID=A0A5C1AF64_9BACT|nr:hypothetical protein [Limnoglobus roseus]QEL17440.1 hypothetical protein PX52LOC_04429 [Limnoglobus roseus]